MPAHPRDPSGSGPAPTEREVKLHVPPEAWEGVRQSLRPAQSRRLPLHAVYHDTPGRALAAAGIALRVRREGERWVQTLKAGGTGLLARLEDNLALAAPAGGPAPAPDLARHRRPAVRAALRQALGLAPRQAMPPLEAVFEVCVERLVREVAEGASRIEIALDEGELVAGTRRLPVREIEFELLEGSTGDLLQLARKWRERHGLWISLASKAARGHRLAQGLAPAPPAPGAAPAYARDARLGAAAAAVLEAALGQVIAHADAVAAGSPDEEPVHQLRTGLRRLRTALREWPPLAAEGGRYEEVLARSFRILGAQRDREHVLRGLQDRIEAAAGRPFSFPEPEVPEAPAGGAEAPQAASAEAAARDPAFQDALLALLARADALGSGDEYDTPPRRALRPRLQALWRQVLDDGHRLRKLDIALQHRVRKRLKRLRYLAESAAPLFPGRRLARFLEALAPAQEALGRYNDTLVAVAACADLAPGDETAAFALAWLERRRRRQLARSQAALRDLAQVRPFWEK
ncbi:CYTH and CHAD domain-containing protein [Ramlibacter sp. MAHUQ-53]|uniref:CYTH and CHAD domain-containing protein n=1 Tax=unclassified Ramlibacter TaxID=2617605 RepID=UPI003626FF60